MTIANGTERTQDATRPPALANGMTPVDRLLKDFDPADLARWRQERAENERLERERERRAAIDHRIAQLIGQAGRRYESATLDSFETTLPGQQHALDAVRGYAAKIADHVRDGAGLVLFGPAGCGKDHLAVAVARLAAEARIALKWISGCDLFGAFRDAMHGEESEASLIAKLVERDLLVLSDPLPPAGVLTDFQRAQLFRVVDGRYREKRATVATVNVANREELDERLGVQLADRLLDGALVVPCSWPSYRATRRLKPDAQPSARGAE